MHSQEKQRKLLKGTKDQGIQLPVCIFEFGVHFNLINFPDRSTHNWYPEPWEGCSKEIVMRTFTTETFKFEVKGIQIQMVSKMKLITCIKRTSLLWNLSESIVKKGYIFSKFVRGLRKDKCSFWCFRFWKMKVTPLI